MKRSIFILLSIFYLPYVSSQEPSAILLNRETNIKIDGAKLVQEELFTILVNNKTGDKYTDIEIPYSKLRKISNIDGSISDKEGNTVRTLKSSDIKDRSRLSNTTFYDDIRIKSFLLTHNSYPYIISYSYTFTSSEFIHIANWFPLISSNVPTIKASLSLSLPQEYKINIRENNIETHTLETQKSGLEYKWQASYKGDISYEKYGPPLDELLPNIKVTPLDFDYGTLGNLSTWQNFGKWQYSLLSNAVNIHDYEKDKIVDLASSTINTKEKISLLYHFLQDNTRYINVSMETGGLKPYPASYVSENKYGDCKALSNYFRTLLKTIGIEAYYTLVYAGDNPVKVDTLYPRQQFNHAILFVPLKSDTLWLDCTSKGPFGYLGTFTQNRHALLIDSVNSRIIKTPRLMPEDVQEERLVNIKYVGSKNPLATVVSKYRGEKYEVIRSILSNYNKTDQNRIFKEYPEMDGLEVLDFNIEPFDRDSTWIKIISNVSCNNLYRKYGKEILAKNIPFSLSEIEKIEDRDNSIRIVAPLCMTDSIYYDIPYGYTFDNTMENTQYQNIFGSYKWEARQVEDKILVTKSFILYSGEYELDDYSELYKLISDAINNENHTYLILK